MLFAEGAVARGLRDMLLCSACLAAFSLSGIAARAADVAPASPTPAPSAPVRHFEINAFEVEGNSVLDEVAIDAAVEPYLGPDRVMSDIDGARAALEKAYASRGYQTVYVVLPPQTVKGGVVRLKAVETKIGSVAVKGTRYASEGRITQALPSLTPGTVPNLKTLNGELVALNGQSGDRQVTPSMKPGAAQDTIDVALDVEDKLALHGGLELNNKYSRDTTPLRLQANLSYDDLWGMGHSLSGLYSVAPQNRDDGEVYALTYSAPIPGSDVKLSATGLVSNSNVNTLGGTDVLGKGHSVTVTGTVPLGTVGDYFHYLTASFAWKDFNDTVALGGQANDAPITYYPLSISYVGSLRGTSDQFSFNAGLTASLRGLGSDRVHFDTARYRADGDFLYTRLGATWLHNLPYGIDLFTEVDGQIANSPLVSNEQFSLGGDGSVRGYLQSEGLGDDGIRASVELRSPNLGQWMGAYMASHVDDLRFVGFLDSARAWLHDPLPQQQSYFEARSFGFGLTGQALQYLNASVFVSDPLDSTVGPGQSGSTKSGQMRVQFRVWTQF